MNCSHFLLLMMLACSALSGRQLVFTQINSAQFSSLKIEAEDGDKLAQNLVATCYYKGYGVPRDFEEAVKWWKKSAEQNFALAQYNLGNAYTAGEGVNRSSELAARWYLLAAHQGLADAQLSIGLAYKYGDGVRTDLAASITWLKKSADQGFALAQFHLGASYYNGEGVTADLVEAYAWYSIASLKMTDPTMARDLLERILDRNQISAGKKRAAELIKFIK